MLESVQANGIETLLNLLPNGIVEIVLVQNNKIVAVYRYNLVEYLASIHQEAETFAS